MPNQSKLKALVAEDDRALADIIRLALQRASFEVAVAHDGSKALRLAQAERFDLIASDYQMPILNGEQFLKELRAGGESYDATLVLCSAKAYELDSERLRDELDLAAVFYKPFSLQELVCQVQDAIQARCASPAPPAVEDAAIGLGQPPGQGPISVNCFLPASRIID